MNGIIIPYHTHIFMGNANFGRVYTFNLNSTKNGFLILDLISNLMDTLGKNKNEFIIFLEKKLWVKFILAALFEELFKQSPLYTNSIPTYIDDPSSFENSYCCKLLKRFEGDVGEWDYVDLGEKGKNHFNNLKQNKILSIYQQE